MKKLFDEILEIQNQAVASAPVSAARLEEVENAASELGFKKTTGDFPIQLFQYVKHDKTPREKFTLTLSKQRKGEFTSVEMAQRAANDNEYYARTIANYVGARLLSDVFLQCKIRDVMALDANAYWKILKAESDRLTENGLTPVLILDNPTRPDWLWEWLHPGIDSAYPRPHDLVIHHRKDDRGNNYIADINLIQVFSGPVMYGESLLLARETFYQVGFTEYRESIFIKAETVEVSESAKLVDLQLSYERSVDVRYPNILRIRYEPGVQQKMAT